MLFTTTFSFLQFLYSVSWKHKKDYLHASIYIYIFLNYVLYFNMAEKH